jgi:hypothetical protein
MGAMRPELDFIVDPNERDQVAQLLPVMAGFATSKRRSPRHRAISATFCAPSRPSSWRVTRVSLPATLISRSGNTWSVRSVN